MVASAITTVSAAVFYGLVAFSVRQRGLADAVLSAGDLFERVEMRRQRDYYGAAMRSLPDVCHLLAGYGRSNPVGCVYSVGSGGAGVFVDQAAESVSSLDSALLWWCYELEGWLLGSGWLEFEAAVRPVGVVVVDVDVEDVLEVSAAADQDPVEALASDGPDAALGVGVGPRRPDGRADDPDSFAVEDLVEGARELAVAVTDQVADGCGSFAQCPGEVARLLGYPRAVWVGGAAGEVQAAAVELDEEEHVEPAKRDRSTVKKSTARTPAACARRNSRHERPPRSPAGPSP